MTEIEEKFEEKFQLSDSVLIFQICEACDKKIKRYGYAAHEEKEVVYFQ
jgi:CRISPR/Cas system-associated endoribonuclease Cas2